MRKETHDSSNIAAIEHEGTRLTIHFRNGSVYDYPDVPAHIVIDFLMAKSAGNYFHHHIRGKYEGKKRG